MIQWALVIHGHAESPSDLERLRVDLHQLVVDDAVGEPFRPHRVHATSVGLRARYRLRHLYQIGRVHDRDRRRLSLAVEVEVDDESVQVVRCEVDRRRKPPEQDRVADHRVNAGLDLPELAVGNPVTGRHVEVAPVLRHPQAVRPFRLYRHLAHRDGLLHSGPIGSKANEVEEIRGFRPDVHPIRG